MSEEKTEQASAKRLRKARRDGKVPKSAEFSSTAAAVAALAALILSFDLVSAQLVLLFEESLRLVSLERVGPDTIGAFLAASLQTLARALVPILVTAFAVSAFVAYVQIGPVFSLKPIIPDGQRLNAANGLKQMFDKGKLVDLAKNVGKIVVMSVIGGTVYAQLVGPMMRSARLDIVGAMSLLGYGSIRLASYLVGALIMFAVIDLLWQRHKFAKDMMMSKQDVKDEYKEAEGSPEVKGRRRQLHRELLAQGTVSRVRDADVVVTNPTQLAVALQYRDGEMDAPRVLTRGRGKTAAEIRRLARRHNVPIVRDVPLARALILIDDDESIPEDLFEAVAEVLRYVYSLKDNR